MRAPRLFPLALLSCLSCLAALSSCRVGVRLPIIGGLGVGVGSDAASELAELQQSGIRVDHHSIDVDVDEDLGYTAIIETRQTVTGTAGLRIGQTAAMTIDPDTQTLEVVEASITTPDGHTRSLGEDNVFEVPSTASRNSPGFVETSTTTVVFPQLSVGSQTSVKWRLCAHTGKLGLNGMYRPHLRFPVTEARVTMRYPESVPLYFDHRGPFRISRSEAGGTHQVSAVLSDYPGHAPEPAMVSPRDVTPVVLVSSMASWAEVGRVFGETLRPEVRVTPEVAAIADRVAGRLEGIDAARALYRWVCRNMQYVVTYLHTSDTWVPHGVDEILANRYGDCKDHYVLLASLFAAKNIAIEPVLVGWDRSYQQLPLWTPQQFDHCIAYLPEFDLYANPTDPFLDMGQLDVMLSGKFVVHAGTEPRVARTPWGRVEDNRYAFTNRVSIDGQGNVEGQSSIQLRGRPSGMARASLSEDRPTVQADHILMATPEGGAGVFETTDPFDLETPFEMVGRWSSSAALDMDDRVFLSTPGGLDLVSAGRLQGFMSGRKRRFDLVGRAIELTWRHEITAPPGYAFTRLPKEAEIENALGSFASSYEISENGVLIVDRHLTLRKDLVPAAEYPRLDDLLHRAVLDSRAILVMDKVAP